ncbi:hypothetical protein [Kribbella voronezhensis]|uniref:hypothetical protein n=1 Tax=Kribbella voronezhensis TaxID=2512212 RepID=UPI0010633677|nr:hypothetical protein [Kribbella voronezhensis]
MPSHQDAVARPKIANWIAFAVLTLTLLGGAFVLIREDVPPHEATEVTTVETSESKVGEAGKTSSSTTTQKTTKPGAEPSAIGRLATPVAILFTKIILLLGTAFVAAALIQRTLLGRYAIKLGSLVEIGEIPDDTKPFGTALQSLAEQPARVIPSESTATGEGPPARTENREPHEDITVETAIGPTGLVQLRLELERVIRSLAAPPPPPGERSAMAMLDVLINRGIVPADLRGPISQLLQAGDRAAHGDRVPERVSRAAEQSGPPILQSLAQRRGSVAQRFEDHVLDVLTEVAPTDAIVRENALFGGAIVDAIVSAGEKEVALEIRSRLTPRAANERERVTRLIENLPTEAPIILIVAGVGLSERQLEHIRRGRSGAVHLVRWDVEADTLGQLLESCLE